MENRNIIFLTLVIATLLIVSTFGGIAYDTKNTGAPDSLELVKEVWDGENWVKKINAEYGDIVSFADKNNNKSTMLKF